MPLVPLIAAQAGPSDPMLVAIFSLIGAGIGGLLAILASVVTAAFTNRAASKREQHARRERYCWRLSETYAAFLSAHGDVMRIQTKLAFYGPRATETPELHQLSLEAMARRANAQNLIEAMDVSATRRKHVHNAVDRPNGDDHESLLLPERDARIDALDKMLEGSNRELAALTTLIRNDFGYLVQATSSAKSPN